MPSEIKAFPYSEEQLNLYLETATGIKEGRLENQRAEKLVLGLKQFLAQRQQ